MSTPEELAISGLVYPIVKDLVLPKIQSIFKKFEIKNTDKDSVEKQLHDYLERRYTKFLTIDTLVFANRQTELKVLYQPLTVSFKNGFKGEEIQIKIDSFSDQLLPYYKKVIIEDTAGMGKSTITKKLFQSIVEEKAGVPVLIELSQIKKKNSILKEIQNQMSQIGKKINQDIILKLINEGNFIFLFDGYDEIALSDREFTIRELHRFIEKAGDNQFLITSRPEGSLVSFGDFQKFNVNPLKNEEAFELLRKYDFYGHHKIAEDLIGKLIESDETLQEYLSNPFLVSLLYKSYEHKKDIPIKKSQFYEQVYDALFEAHDLSKDTILTREKNCNLHKDDFGRVLRYLGFFTSVANKVEYDKNSIIQFIGQAKKRTSDLKFKASDYLKDLLETVPLFKKEGNNFKWAHKSLQDYFAAKFVWIDAKDNRIDILKKIYEDDENQRFFNVLLLYCELDRKGFESTILRWLLTEFKEFKDNNYNDFSKTDKNVKKRVEMSFAKELIIITVTNTLENIESTIDNKFKNPHKVINNKGILDVSFVLSIINDFEKTVTCIIKPKMNLVVVIELLEKLYKDLSYKLIRYPKNKLNDELNKIAWYEINDDVQNIVNKKENFKLFNDFFNGSGTASYHNLDYDKALAKLKELEKNNPEKEKNELLDW